MNSKEAMNQILWETRNFIKEIIKETVPDPERYSMRLEVSDQCLKVLIYNDKTEQIVGQPYDIKKFLSLCSEEKLEFQLNVDVKKLVLLSDEKTNRKVRWM